MKVAFLEKLKELDKLNLNKKSYAIIGSGPLAIRGIRPAEDIDIIVKPSLWRDLVTKYKVSEKKVIRIGFIEIWSDFLNLTPILEKVINEAERIEGYPFVTLDYTISWKKFLNRKKDQDDIVLVENFLKKQS